MYKVFYNDRTVFFIDNDKKINNPNSDNIHYFKNKKQLKLKINSFQNNPDLKELFVIHKDIDFVFRKFTKLYKVIEASGGLVKSAKNDILVIFRRGKWDLPKGKIEKRESPKVAAIREVEEECGIGNLEIVKLIDTTYHTYKLKDKNILKRTYWYEMLHKEKQVPSPQTEEEITEACWIKSKELDKVLKNTFPSIKEVLKKANVK